MGQYYDSFGFGPQQSMGKLELKAKKEIDRNLKKGKCYQSIAPISGQKIVHTWWGNAWCVNLERYADFENRLGRGKSYVRHGAVIDLNIEPGNIHALVIGSEPRPYQIHIQVDKISSERLEYLKNLMSEQIESVELLLAGKFPDSLKSTLLQDGMLFPTPDELHFNCSCPDAAYMCKHVAAVLYGVGIRLETEPFVFFTLRGIDIKTLIHSTVITKVESMLKNAHCKTSRVMDEKDLSIFGIL